MFSRIYAALTRKTPIKLQEIELQEARIRLVKARSHIEDYQSASESARVEVAMLEERIARLEGRAVVSKVWRNSVKPTVEM